MTRAKDSMAKAKSLPSRKYLLECFDLHSDDGFLFWKQRPISHFVTAKAMRTFNKNFAFHRADYEYPGGYRRIRITMDGERLTLAAHRVIFKMVTGREPKDRVCFLDGNGHNNSPTNLFDKRHK